MKKLTLLFLTIPWLLSCLFPVMQASAQANGLSLHIEQVDAAGFPTVSIRLNAWDGAGLPFANLSATDIDLQEDGGAPFHPANLAADTQAPLGVALVLDISSSMAGAPINDAKVAAARFLDRLQKGDQAALVAFSNPVDPDPGLLDPARELAFTTDLAPVYDLVEKLTANGSTQLYNASTKAVRMTAGLPAGHRAVLLLTDGRNEPAEIGNPDEAIRLAQEANIPFFVIGLGDQIDETYLRRLASETGGLYRAAPRSSELAQLFADTAILLKTQYLLSYQSPLAPDGARHALTVRLNTAQGSTDSKIEFGPLPAAPIATATPEPTVTAIPPSATPVWVATPQATLVPTPEPFFSMKRGWGWALGAVIVLALVLLFVYFNMRRPTPPTPEICAQCGFDLTGKPGACPQCGSSRRMPKRK